MKVEMLVLSEGLEDRFKGDVQWCLSLRDQGEQPRCVTNFKYFPNAAELDRWKGKLLDQRVVLGVKEVNPPYNGCFRIDGQILGVVGENGKAGAK